MTDPWHITIADEARMRLLAELVATKVTAGDMITLQGDLGAGKTTFCRYLIRAVIGDDLAEVPSPTFTLVQSYETPRFEINHFDLYRISDAEELHELGFDPAASEAVSLVEWPERAEGHLGSCRFDVMIAEAEEGHAGGGGDARRVVIAASGDAERRLRRMQAAWTFLETQFDDAARRDLRLTFLQGDASARGYARVMAGGRTQLLMDMPKMPDGPVVRDGKTYSELAHLAEDARPFVAIAYELRSAGLSAPEIHTYDEARGMALIEDLGAMTFADAMARGVAQETLWHAAKDVLVALRAVPAPRVAGKAGGVTHPMPAYDSEVMLAETALLAEWYWPHTHDGQAIEKTALAAFEAAWQPLIEAVATGAPETGAWVLRDYHSPNLIWLPDRAELKRVGIIDFQDAQIGHAAYDLVSLSMDARLDVPRTLHEALIDDYCAQVARMAMGTKTSFDPGSFRRAAAILGAQRNTKILGIFARLSMRDGKHGYLRHIPRIKQYLNWCLEHPDLARLRGWYRDVLGLRE